MLTTNRLIATILACVVMVAFAASSYAVVILGDEFVDADRTAITGTFGSWDTVNGITAPAAELDFFDGDSPAQVGFHDNALNDADGAFDVNNNMTAGGWDTTIELAVGAANLDLTSLVVDIKLTNGSGAGQSTNSKQGQLLVEFFDSGNNSVGTADLGGNINYPSVKYSRTLDLTGITLSAGQTYSMVLQARGTGFGHHKALDALELNGDIDGGGGGPTFIPGDFNGDGMVDGADYALYADSVGLDGDTVFADGSNVGGTVGPADYDLWRSNFGATAPGDSLVGGGEVPEPSTIALLAGALGLIAFARRK